MPLIESPPDALAEIYARSLFEVAEAAGGAEAMESTLGELEEILELARQDPALNEFLASRVVPLADRKRSLRAIFQGRASDLALHFLLLLNDKGRLSHLPAIVASLDQIVQDAVGRVEVDVYTAAPIEAEQLRQIKEQLQKIMAREAIVHPYTDESMLGGIRLRVGDQLVDGALSTKLRHFRDQLAVSGKARMRQRIESVLEGE
ncbi:MAG: ATP synthase F1 subunit delta [Phycisphaerales bacterium JB039]